MSEQEFNDLAGERLLPKLVVIVVLCLGLAVASELADDGLRQARLQSLETPATAPPSAEPFDARAHRELAER